MSDKIRGALFGVAFGDALGAPTEFMSIPAITRVYGPRGPHRLPRPAEVTDDTQMMLAVADALVATQREGSLRPATLEPHLRDRFITWWDSPENDRAPGGACMAACRKMYYGAPWKDATGRSSKGCGANMRVIPVGLISGVSGGRRAGAAQLQAAMTHGHPVALAASDATAYAVHSLAVGLPVSDLYDAVSEYCWAQRHQYRQDWLGDLGGPNRKARRNFIRRGWDGVFDALVNLDVAVGKYGRDVDPCRIGGGGWVAEQALATAMYCLMRFPDDPVAVVGRAAASSGDSDSIAAIAGGLAGAAYGADGWPAEWFEQIEYRAELERLAVDLGGSHG